MTHESNPHDPSNPRFTPTPDAGAHAPGAGVPGEVRDIFEIRWRDDPETPEPQAQAADPANTAANVAKQPGRVQRLAKLGKRLTDQVFNAPTVPEDPVEAARAHAEAEEQRRQAEVEAARQADEAADRAREAADAQRRAAEEAERQEREARAARIEQVRAEEAHRAKWDDRRYRIAVNELLHTSVGPVTGYPLGEHVPVSVDHMNDPEGLMKYGSPEWKEATINRMQGKVAKDNRDFKELLIAAEMGQHSAWLADHQDWRQHAAEELANTTDPAKQAKLQKEIRKYDSILTHGQDFTHYKRYREEAIYQNWLKEHGLPDDKENRDAHQAERRAHVNEARKAFVEERDREAYQKFLDDSGMEASDVSFDDWNSKGIHIPAEEGTKRKPGHDEFYLGLRYDPTGIKKPILDPETHEMKPPELEIKGHPVMTDEKIREILGDREPGGESGDPVRQAYIDSWDIGEMRERLDKIKINFGKAGFIPPTPKAQRQARRRGL